MPMRRSSFRHALLAASALALTIGMAPAAYAFSQIAPGDGVSESREGIIAVPLPPLPSTESPDEPAPARTPVDGVPADGARSKGAAPGPAGEPEGTDSEEVPISPEDEDVLRQRNAPGRGNRIEDSAPLRSVGQSDDPRSPEPRGEQARPSQDTRPTRSDAGAQSEPGGGSPAPVPTGTLGTPGAVKPYTSTGAGSRPTPPDDAATGEADRGDAVAPAVPLPSQIAFGEDDLPRPVRDLRDKLMQIARSGDIEKLRPYLQGGDEATVLSFGDVPGDPVAFLKQASGDGEGVEMLAILLEVLQSGHAHVEPGDADEIYVWPYFTQVQIDALTKPQMVQLFELVTAGDYEAMKAFGAYNFYRVGISPDGKLEFFVAGD